MGEKVDNAPENVDKSNQSFSLTLGIKVYILSFKKMKLAPLGDTLPPLPNLSESESPILHKCFYF